ncbi:thiamine phosphate synthase [Bauldia sp.]|uniref:thiamine phosphate synthase n=1 Tax=Bauldia sp. TaxID=2575872 RepID=UPI003BAD428D
MPDTDDDRCRLCLVVPAGADPVVFAPLLRDALGGGDVAAVIVAGSGGELAAMAAAAVPIAQAEGAAVLVQNDREVAERIGADGVHHDQGAEGAAAVVEALPPGRIVGVGGLKDRHQAMTAGEADPDYVFFGLLDGDRDDAIFPKALDMAAWWSSIFVVPAMVMGGRTPTSVSEAANIGIEFVALRDAVWTDPAGPAAAVAAANKALVRVGEAAQ